MKFDYILFILLLVLPIRLGGGEDVIKRCCPTCGEMRYFVWNPQRIAHECPVCKKLSWVDTEGLNKKFNMHMKCGK
jgi:hypothetical protein